MYKATRGHLIPLYISLYGVCCLGHVNIEMALYDELQLWMNSVSLPHLICSLLKKRNLYSTAYQTSFI